MPQGSARGSCSPRYTRGVSICVSSPVGISPAEARNRRKARRWPTTCWRDARDWRGRRVDDWRGCGRRMGVAVPGGFRPSPVPHSPPLLRFQSPLIEPDVRISRIRLSDEIMPSPTETRRARAKAGEPVLLPEPLVRKPHVESEPHLVLAAEPLAQPPRGVAVNRGVGPG